MKTLKALALFLSLAVVTWNCASKEEEEAKEEPKTGLEALQKLGEEAEKMSKEGPKETVDPKLLKELLPSDADGLKRREASSEKNAMMGFGVSVAKATYRDDNGQDIEVNISDVAGMGVALMGMAAWSMASIDKETETGYEKTTEYKGHKAFEKYDTQSKHGEISVIVANRYIVQVEGRDVEMDKIKSVMNDIDLDKLADIK